MISLENLRLEDIAPDSIKIPDVLAFFNALDPELQKITLAISETLLMTRIDELPEAVIDLLAWQLHVDFYEPLGLDLDRKRALVKNSLMWHRYKGTKYAVESMLREIFDRKAKIDEWFEYGGDSYFFRVHLNPDIHHDLGVITGAVHELKNTRSWIGGFVFYPFLFINHNHFVLQKFGMHFSIYNNLPPFPQWNGAIKWNGEHKWHSVFKSPVSISHFGVGINFINKNKNRIKNIKIGLQVKTKQPPMSGSIIITNTWNGQSRWDGSHKWDGILKKEDL